MPTEKRVNCSLQNLQKSYAEVSRLLKISEAALSDHITKANHFLKANYDKAIPFAIVMFCQNILK